MGLAKMETSKNWLKIGIFSPAIGHFVSYFFYSSMPCCPARPEKINEVFKGVFMPS